ncbi:MAG: putative cytosolic protein [Candidatus Binatus sp.]|jgi:HPt (histidine-containing phosphotransfer) domain-containing protein|nr:putative cytosolic protein [Candidatus Binatus sp.]
MTERVVVEINEELSDLIPGFLSRKRIEINSILVAVANHDYSAIGQIAHRLKGEGGSYGFDAITEIGDSIEIAATSHDDKNLIVLANRLLRYLDNVDIVFEASSD